MKVCVVGGGTSGTEAAREAEARGADVTVVEKSDLPDPPWRSWPAALGPGASARSPPAGGEGGWTLLRKEAKSVREDRVTTADGRSISADGIVMATGCGFDTVPFPGIRRRGVVVLDGISKYFELARAKDEVGRAVVCGDGFRALQVAEKLLEGGRTVRLLVDSWSNGEPSGSVLAALKRAAMLQGLSFLGKPLSRALGGQSVEAVVAAGEVVTCDALVVVPRRVPRTVASNLPLGCRGGYLVDHTLKAGRPPVHAAGGCAELQAGPLSCALADEAAPTGRIAGANSTGENLRVGPVKFESETAFGVVWSRTALRGRATASRDLLSTAHRRGETSVCTITYERAGGRAVSIEWVDEGRGDSRSLMPPSPGLSLRSLAYASCGGSSDISLVSEAAREGLREWRRS